MRKTILLSIFTLSSIFLPAASVNDSQGDYTVSRNELSKWFNFCLDNSWQMDYFVESNKEFFEWEIEKKLKIKLFRMDFFSRTYLDINQTIKYMTFYPKAAKKLIYLTALYNEFGGKAYSFCGSEELEYLLLKYDPSWKDNTKRRFYRGEADRIIKKYEKHYIKKKQLSPEEIKQKAYNNYIKNFKNSRYSFTWDELVKKLGC